MKSFLTLFIVVTFTTLSFSNNIQVTSATLTNQNTSGDYTFVQFNLSWENSWRDAINWDAAYVFVKFKASYDSAWKHATLHTSASYHVIPAGFVCSPMSDGVGILIYRNALGNGNNNLTNVQLRWLYGTDGVNDGDVVSVKVFAIEMVYIPQGNFYAGDGTSNNVTGQFSQGNTTLPYLITSENAITLGGTSTSNLGNRNASGMYPGYPDDFNYTTTQTLPASFPKGYDDFYVMKYEISQGQYTEFLNTLTRHQQKYRVASDISGDAVINIYVMSNTSSISYRNVISCPTSGNGTAQPIVFSCTRPDRACNLITWYDGCAYLDWAGLRPMTELEFEKVCRGPLFPVADEWAWGTVSYTYGSTISGMENGTEYITTANANTNKPATNYLGGDGGSGPLRCGIFARATTTREQSGATYYGVMDMSGNMGERCISVGHSTGRLFDGQHGNGLLNLNGFSDVSNWPNSSPGGSNIRCRYFNTDYNYRISDRIGGAILLGDRTSSYGFRGVRTSVLGTMSPEKKTQEKQNNN